MPNLIITPRRQPESITAEMLNSLMVSAGVKLKVGSMTHADGVTTFEADRVTTDDENTAILAALEALTAPSIHVADTNWKAEAPRIDILSK